MPSFRASLLFKNSDVVFADNTPKFRYMKKEMMTAIRQHGDGLKHIESMSIKCGTQLLNQFAAQGSRAFDPFNMLRTCTATIMMNLVYGSSTPQDVDTFIEKENKMVEFFDPASHYMLLDIFPALRFILPSMRKAYNDCIREMNALHQLLNKYTEKRKEVVETSQAQVFIDHFLNLQDKSMVDSKSQQDITISYDNVIMMGTDMMIAGMSITANVLYILLGILVNHPHVQDRAYEEIMSVLGERTPSIEDKENLAYLEALVWETFRYSALSALLVPHYNKQETRLKGYLIPKNTAIFINIWNLHHDERFWRDPWVFDPQRFLQNGSIVPADHKNKQRILLFSAGRRQCPGEAFTKNRIFILLTMMLQKFKFLPAEGFPKPKHDPREYDPKVNLQIQPYHLCVEVRK